MKQIELTEEHKSKLLEMCRKLFPEYKFVSFVEEAILGAGWDFEFNNICFSEKSTDIFDIKINIHWFEFCIKNLIPKLDNDLQTIIDSRILFCELPNPIDYLYEKFKTL